MSLKRELESVSSPLRVALEAMLPDLGRHARATWNAQMKGVQPTFNPDLPPDVLGHAISERIAWQFAGITGPLHGAATLMMTGADTDVDADREARVACLVGLADRSMRTGLAIEPWYEPLLSASTLDEALAAVDPAWVDDVVSTSTTALAAASPLAAKAPVVRAPTFAGSPAVGGADADLILGHTLVEVKSSRLNDLRKRDLQQVVSYSLLDWDNAYGITEVAVLAARHGQLVRWPLEQLITSGSRGEHDLASARAHVKAALLT